METKFDEIYHLFLSKIDDYELRHIFYKDYEIGEDILNSLLVKAIPKFYNCVKDIKNFDSENKSFLCTLDVEEIEILSSLMTVAWMETKINDIRQMNLTLLDNDFKHFSEESNLKQKSEYFDRMREKVNQDIVNYGLYRTPFDRWAVGDYDI